MYFNKLLLCITLVGLSYFNGFTQHLYKAKTKSPYYLLYKLDADQVKYITKFPNKLDTNILFNNLVGKISSDSVFPLRHKMVYDFQIHPFYDQIKYQKCMPRFHIWDINQNGYFLEVMMYDVQIVNYRLIENPLFTCSVKKIGYETFIFVQDTAGIPVKDAKICLDTAQCIYDISIGGYEIKGKNINGIIKIEKNNQFTITQLIGELNKQNNTAPPRDKYKYDRVKYQGYLVSNKPKYQPWDTLFFKSYLVNHKGKPLREKLRFRISQNQSGFAKEKLISPDPIGSYHGYFELIDSFYSGYPIQIYIMNKRGVVVMNKTFLFENYQLKDIQFSAKADKNLVTPGDGIKFYVSSQTMNGLPIMDAKIKLKLQLQNVNYLDSDSAAISFHKWTNWFQTTVQSDPSGITIIEIPDSVFIPMDAVFVVNIDLITSDFETKNSLLYFNYKTTRDRIESSLINDTLVVNRLYKMKSIQKPMRIKLFSKKDLIGDTILNTPIKYYLPPNIYYAALYKNDSLVGTYYRQVELPKIDGKRTSDSVFISFKAKPDITVHYRIYANNKIVQSGEASEINFKAKDVSKNSYHLQYGVLDGSVLEPKFYSQSFHLAEKKLNIQVNHPDVIFPGQEVAIEVTVKDAYHNPVKDVNLTAWAVNTQIGDLEDPNVPYLGLNKFQKALPIKPYYTQTIQPNYSSFLSNWQIDKFFLYHNPIFKLVYPKGAYQNLKDTTPFRTTEVEFFVHGSKIRQNISYVKANDTVLISSIYSPNPSVVKIKPGIYQFQIRTFDRIFTLKDIVITKGYKHCIGINLDSIIHLKIGDTISAGRYTSEEKNEFLKQAVLFRFDYNLYDTLLIKVNKALKTGVRPQNFDYYLKSLNLVSSLYNPDHDARKQKSIQKFYLYGPVKQGDEIEFQWKNNYTQVINFTPNSTYGFTKTDMVIDENQKWIDQLNWITMPNNAVLVLDLFCWDPYYKDTTKPKIINPYNYKIPHTPQTYVPPYNYKNYNRYELPNILNSYLNIYIPNTIIPRRTWLINTDDSSYSSLENYNYFHNGYQEISKAARRNFSATAAKKQIQNFKLYIEINDSQWYVKSLKIDSSQYYFYTLQDIEKRKLGLKEFIELDRLVKILGREPLSPFVDTPTVDKGYLMFTKDNKQGKTIIDGTVIGPNLRYPINNAFVILESNGRFVNGAITNADGRFVIKDIVAGQYMLKIKAQNYHYWIHYSIKIENGKSHFAQISLKAFHGLYFQNNVYQEEMLSKNGEYYLNSSGAPTYNYSSPSNDSYTMDVVVSENGKAKRGVAGLAKITPGANVKNGQISFLGNRSDGRRTFVDGVAIIGSDKESNFDSDEDGIEDFKDREPNAMDDLIEKTANNPKAKLIRKDFKDYAYWIPNLNTNKAGKAYYTVIYPDNITNWQSYIPAMNGNRQSGLLTFGVKSYKPLVSTIAMPKFLTEGDSLLAYSRILNYASKPLLAFVKQKTLSDSFQKEIWIKNYLTDSIWVSGKKVGDILNFESSVSLANGYKDGELRKVSIQSAQVVFGKSSFVSIKNDTTFKVSAQENDIVTEIAIYSENWGIINEILEDIEKQSREDNYSLATYLKMLLIKKEIAAQLKIKFTQEKELKATFNQLKKAQKADGCFHWFFSGRPSSIVSTYVAQIMYMAHQKGYQNNVWNNASKYFQNQIANVDFYTKLQYLLCLKQMNIDFDYDKHVSSIQFPKLDESQKLDYMLLNQYLQKPVNTSEIYSLLKATPLANIKVEGTWNWNYSLTTDDAANTYKTWQILYHAKKDADIRKQLINYLANECESEKTSKIFAVSALLSEAKLDSVLQNQLNPQIWIDQTEIKKTDFPTKIVLRNTESKTIKHSGGEVYLATKRLFKTYNPISDYTQFDIKTTFNQESQTQFQLGKAVSQKITVFAKRNQYNIVVEIPIPAGFVFTSKIQNENPYENQRIYLHDRVLIYLEELPFGYHHFTLNMMPKFSGKFSIPPARVALSFYPDKCAYTPKQSISVSK